MTLIIAEAGVNHNGDLNLALKLVEAAAQAGADIVKFQTFRAQELATHHASKASYQKKTTDESESQFSMLHKLELRPDWHITISNHCKSVGIEFLSTAFDLTSIDLLNLYKPNRWKIPSGEITNLPYLRKIGSYGDHVILSTGMATFGEIEAAIGVLESSGTLREKITVLHCTTEYPAPLDEVNLRAMIAISQGLGVEVGYSDHTEGIAIPIAAVAMGAKVIEKHLTLDCTMEGPDHRASLEPDEFSSMVDGIRAVELALGDGIKRPTASERSNLPIVRKSVVASASIQLGEPFTAENLTTKRPGTGISPMHLDVLLGLTAKRAYSPDELIEW